MTDYQNLTITIEGVTYEKENFCADALPSFALKSPFYRELYLFLKDWYSSSPTLAVQTSGSTGAPKQMQASKLRMMQSAKLTCSFLQLKPKDKTLLCMSLDYIAGKMMAVRSLVAGLDLYAVQPCGHPLESAPDVVFDFSAMIPLQVYNSLKNETERKQFEKINAVIIGGGAIDEKLERQLQPLRNNIYSSYGMTETLSHVALRKLSGKDASLYYQPFSSVNLSLSDDRALIIDAPSVAEQRLYTNDIAEINADGSFRILGRKDNIINSGGIKIQAEEVERLLKPLLDVPFAVSALPDEKFGEIVALAVEKPINETLLRQLPKYYQPKKVVLIPKIPLTGTSKINRKGLKECLLAQVS
jgi:O-succinylbenzoic acid--CoA ligase